MIVFIFTAIAGAVAITAAVIGAIFALLRLTQLRDQIESDLGYFPLYARQSAIASTPAILKKSNAASTQRVVDHEHLTCASAMKEAPPLAELITHFKKDGRKLHAQAVVFKSIGLVAALFILMNIVYWGIVVIGFWDRGQSGSFNVDGSDVLLVFICSFIPSLLSLLMALFINFLWVRQYASAGYQRIFKRFGKVGCDINGSEERPSRLHDYT